jgi:hypothetical protein
MPVTNLDERDATGTRLESAPISKRRKFRFNVRLLLIVMAIVAVTTWIGTKIHFRAQLSAQEVQIRSLMRFASLGVLNHESARGVLPPPVVTSEDGTPLSSWRFLIMAYIEQNPLNGGMAWDPNSAWDAPVHGPIASRWHYYRFPGNPSPTAPNLYAIAGPGAAFDPNRNVLYSELDKDVVLAIEIANSKLHWMQPGDYDVQQLVAAKGRLGNSATGVIKDRIHILFADGEVWALSPDMPVNALKPFLTLTGAKTAARDKQLAPYRVD